MTQQNPYGPYGSMPPAGSYQRQLSFGEAIKRGLFENYCNFSGRSSRSEYWWFCLFTTIIGTLMYIFFGDGTAGRILTGIIELALILPSLGVAVRRLHDVDKSGWWLFISLIPLIGAIILIYWYIKPSQEGPNRYGDIPNLVNQ